MIQYARPISFTTSSAIEASQDSCPEEKVVRRTLVLSTIVMALALLTGAHMAAAQSSDEAAIEQVVEAFRNAMNYTLWMAMNHRQESGQEPIMITREVQQETVEVGLDGGYRDGVAINERIDAGRIEVRTGSATGNSSQRTRAGKRGRDDDLN
jgi:hypothetical protein